MTAINSLTMPASSMTPTKEKTVDDIDVARTRLSPMPRDWDGRRCVLELKQADYHWKQMEWWAFYFEWCCGRLLQPEFEIPGERIGGRVPFDARRSITWDFKAKAIKSDNHHAILNDIEAVDEVIDRDGAYGVVIGLCDVEYNDSDRSFQQWHTQLKGGLSDYERQRIKRTSTSRYRKTSATLSQIVFIVVDDENRGGLDMMNQGRNSNGEPRPPKYMLDLDHIEPWLRAQINFEHT